MPPPGLEAEPSLESVRATLAHAQAKSARAERLAASETEQRKAVQLELQEQDAERQRQEQLIQKSERVRFNCSKLAGVCDALACACTRAREHKSTGAHSRGLGPVQIIACAARRVVLRHTAGSRCARC